MRVNLIAAQALNRVIGDNNRLPWSLPEDLRYFKTLTLNHTIIMGRNTFDSIGKPLKERRNIVLSSRLDLVIDQCTVCSSLTQALQLSAHENAVFIIGGSQVYQEALKKNLVDRIYLTEIQEIFAGDSYFPILKKDEWCEVSREHQTSTTGLAFDFVIYDRHLVAVNKRSEINRNNADKRSAFKAFMARQEQFLWG